MSTMAVGIAAPTLSTSTAARPRAGRGFFGRMLDRMIAARMKQAEIEVRRQMALLPPSVLKRAGYSFTNDRELPFNR